MIKRKWLSISVQCFSGGWRKSQAKRVIFARGVGLACGGETELTGGGMGVLGFRVGGENRERSE